MVALYLCCSLSVELRACSHYYAVGDKKGCAICRGMPSTWFLGDGPLFAAIYWSGPKDIQRFRLVFSDPADKQVHSVLVLYANRCLARQTAAHCTPWCTNAMLMYADYLADSAESHAEGKLHKQALGCNRSAALTSKSRLETTAAVWYIWICVCVSWGCVHHADSAVLQQLWSCRSCVWGEPASPLSCVT